MVESVPVSAAGHLSRYEGTSQRSIERVSRRPLRVKRGLLNLQISDQLLGSINRELIADRE